MGGSGSGSGSSSGAACLRWWHAMELIEMQGQPSMVALASDVAAASNDVAVLSVALSVADNVVPLRIVLASSPVVTGDPTFRRVTVARQALPSFLGQALHIDGGTFPPDSRP